MLSTEPETEEGERYRMDKIKELSDDIEVRKLYGDPFTFSPQFGLIIQANEDPVFTADKKSLTMLFSADIEDYIFQLFSCLTQIQKIQMKNSGDCVVSDMISKLSV